MHWGLFNCLLGLLLLCDFLIKLGLLQGSVVIFGEFT